MTTAAKAAANFLKSTLRLPSSNFPPRAPPHEIASYLPQCTDDLYVWQRHARPASNPFVLHDGPPYANGELHVGHALNKIIKDIVCRTKLAEGKRVNYVPGWDCHGLPIELKALEKTGYDRKDVDAGVIRKAARAFAQDAVKKQMEGFRSWAVMGDWSNHWKTMDKDFELRQLAVFRAMAQRGLIYRKHKPVYWSPSSGTALAEAELEYNDDHVSTAAFVKFPIRGPAAVADAPTHALIWTTTPWTLPANQAIALNASLEYCCVHSENHGTMILAKDRLHHLESVIAEELAIDHTVSIGSLLESTYSGLPQFGPDAGNRLFVHADFVSAESGTGLVHCAPGHGLEDYDGLQDLIRSGRVLVKAPVDGAGRFDASASPEEPALLEQQDIFTQGNQSVLTMLEHDGRLVHRHQYKHKYPIDWRTKQPVIIRATQQWFADLSMIKTDALQALESVSFVPENGRSRIRSFVENRSEWCISRQRAWGVPIPAIYHRSTGEAVLTSESVSHIIKVIEERGIDAWWSDPADDPAWIEPNLLAADFTRGTDTMDVWFDSGSSWTSLLASDGQQSEALADVYLEGTDQHRGWFQSSLLTNIAYQKSFKHGQPAHAPFKSLITHGFTLDGQGKKMSKSLGNVIEPVQIMTGLEPVAKVGQPATSKKLKQVHPLGPDALRLWVASSDWTKDVVVSETVVKTVHTSLAKYRITFKLLLGMLQDFDPKETQSYTSLSQLDQIALLHLHNVTSTVRQAFAEYEFHRAVTMINRWVVADLSGFYIEAVKDIIYCDSPTSHRRPSAQTTLHHILGQMQEMLGPLTPLLVEESWAHSPERYHASLQPPLRRIMGPVPGEWHNAQLGDLLPNIMAVNSSVKAVQEEARAEKLMGQSLASDVHLFVKPGLGLSAILADTWKEILVVSDMTIIEDEDFWAKALEQSSTESVPGWVYSRDVTGSDGNRIGVVVVSSPAGDKCSRCWKYVVEPGKRVEVKDHALPLCDRCSIATELLGG